jgi:hypothetical protein
MELRLGARNGAARRVRTSTRLGALATVALIVLALALPSATAAARSTDQRVALTNITTVGADCLTGAHKGGAHQGSVTYSPDPGSPGYFHLTIVIRHGLANTTYYIDWSEVPFYCAQPSAVGVLTDAGGNYSGVVPIYMGNASSTYWIQLRDAIFTDVLATKAVTF